MKRVCNYIAVFLAGIILGEIGIRSILNKVMKEITRLKMDSVFDVFSSREIASGIWIIIFSLIFLSKSKIRKSLLKVVQAATVKKIIIPVIVILVYTATLIIVTSWFSFWEWKYMKDVTFWVMFVGIPISFEATSIKENDHYFVDIVKNNLKFTVIVEFLLNTITFNILTELIILPILMFLILSEVIVATKDEHEKTKKVLSFTIAFMSFTIIVLTLKIAIENYITFKSLDLLISFSAPIILSLFFIPIAYIFAIYSEYELLFIKMSFREPENQLVKRRNRWEIIKACKFSHKRVAHFKKVYLKKFYVDMNPDDFYQIMEQFKKYSS